MPITASEQRKYDEFVLSIVKEAGALDAPPANTLLWHYTNGSGLLGIIQSGSLFATQVSCLNDAEEIKYASSIFKSALSTLKDDQTKGKEVRTLAEAALKYFGNDEDYVGSLPYFVACFTQLEDSIGQWQGYGARGENGYAIGFDPAGLTQMGGLLVRVNYDKAKHEELAMKVASKTIDFYGEGVKGAESPEQWGEEFLTQWDEKITQLAPLIKDDCWAHEKEYRIIKLLVRGQLPELRILQKETMMTRHLPMKMITDVRYPTLPIRKVIIGPCPHPSISRVSADTLLRQHGYPSGIAVSSKRPYRNT